MTVTQRSQGKQERVRYWLDEGNAALWVSSAAIILWVVQYTILVRWWRDSSRLKGTRFIGITIVGLAVALLLIYIPSLMALADPADFGKFAGTTWYQILAIIIVNATMLFMVTRIFTWEYLRRGRQGNGRGMLPADMAHRIMELEAENQHLRERLAEATGR